MWSFRMARKSVGWIYTAISAIDAMPASVAINTLVHGMWETIYHEPVASSFVISLHSGTSMTSMLIPSRHKLVILMTGKGHSYKSADVPASLRGLESYEPIALIKLLAFT